MDFAAHDAMHLDDALLSCHSEAGLTQTHVVGPVQLCRLLVCMGLHACQTDFARDSPSVGEAGFSLGHQDGRQQHSGLYGADYECSVLKMADLPACMALLVFKCSEEQRSV